MTLHETIQRDIIAAMKAKAEADLSALRLLRSAVKNAEIDKRVTPLPDADILAIIKTMIKQQRDAMTQFAAGGRNDLVKKAEDEIKIIEKYLPPQVSEEEVRRVVVAKTAGASAKDYGRVMGEVMKELKGKADGAMVGRILKEILK